MYCDNKHGRLMQELRKGIRPTTMVRVGDGTSFDCRTIRSSWSHWVQKNCLTGGKSADDPLQIDRTPPVDLFPYGMAAVGEISPATFDGWFAGISSARSLYVLSAAAPPSVQNEHEAEVERMVLKSMDHTKERAKSGKSPAVRGRF